jgi:hypothetical protein
MSEQSNSERPPSVVTGVTWYSPDEWSIIPDHVADPETFDYPYQEWLNNAEKTVERLQDAKTRVYRILFRIDDFLVWCHQKNKQPNSEARSEYTHAETKRIHG